jgi:hypothetical protein
VGNQIKTSNENKSVFSAQLCLNIEIRNTKFKKITFILGAFAKLRK